MPVDDKRTTMAVGRILGWLKKKDEQLYEYLVEKAQNEGVKPSDLIVEALRSHYITPEELLEKMSARELLIIIRKWNEITKDVIGWQLEFLRTFWIEGFQRYSDMINAIAESIKEEEKTKPKKKISVDTMFEIMSRMMELISTMPITMMSAMTGQQLPIKTSEPETPELIEV